MIYFLKKTTPSKKGLYLQIYTNFYDAETKKKKTKSYRSLGYVSDLIKSGIEDPVQYYSEEVKRMNSELVENKDIQISDNVSATKYMGHFLVKAMFDLLGMDRDINIMTSTFKCHYKFSDMFRTLCYSQILSPGSKHKAFEKIIPNIYGVNDYSYDQILDAVNFIGTDYHKYIECMNHHIERNWERNTEKVYFDCTNYYFEIDLENDFLRKGPSKENRRLPLMGQALLLDSDQIPLDTVFYPGNESEKPYLRQRIEDMKTRNNVTGKVIQVADKGLNCARNIYSAVIEAKDGYIFSKAIRGNSLSDADKQLILLSDNSLNKWTDVKDTNGDIIFRYKVQRSIGKNGKIRDYDTYQYSCYLDETDEKVSFSVNEKRIITYNPCLAKKQKSEILREVEKLKKTLSYKRIVKEELGDSVKYVKFESTSKPSLNMDKINEDLNFAGYNLLVTSEIYANPEDIYFTYHKLWRIEESFRIMKTYLEARPVFLSNEYTIKGHFLICYISLTLIRLLELKIFDDLIPASQLFDFIRNYNVTQAFDGSFINSSTSSSVFNEIKRKLGLAKLGNLYLSKKDVDSLLDTELV